MNGKRLTEDELQTVIVTATEERDFWVSNLPDDPECAEVRDYWELFIRTVLELRDTRAELDALRAAFAEVAGVDLPGEVE